jgi:hypothetical protein
MVAEAVEKGDKIARTRGLTDLRQREADYYFF